MATAGGLQQLNKIPSCNLQVSNALFPSSLALPHVLLLLLLSYLFSPCCYQVMGIKRATIAGFSTQSKDMHVGLLGQSPLMKDAPTALRQKMLRQVCLFVVNVNSFAFAFSSVLF
jgi:RNA processing factor Prp31